MQFKPKTEKELAEENLIAEGVYPFEVIEAESGRSKAGNDMIVLKLRLFLDDGRERILTDYLMEKVMFKLFHFCSYCGLATQYNDGSLVAADCLGKSGYAKIGIKVDKANQYPDQNSVRDYVRPEFKKPGAVVNAGPTDAQLENRASAVTEDVPF